MVPRWWCDFHEDSAGRCGRLSAYNFAQQRKPGANQGAEPGPVRALCHSDESRHRPAGVHTFAALGLRCSHWTLYPLDRYHQPTTASLSSRFWKGEIQRSPKLALTSHQAPRMPPRYHAGCKHHRLHPIIFSYDGVASPLLSPLVVGRSSTCSLVAWELRVEMVVFF